MQFFSSLFHRFLYENKTRRKNIHQSSDWIRFRAPFWRSLVNFLRVFVDVDVMFCVGMNLLFVA